MTRRAPSLAVALLFATIAAFCAGCLPTLTAESTAPPGRTARLDAETGFWCCVKYYRLELSQGVAVAVSCNAGGPCEKLAASSDDPAVAEVRPAALTALRPAGTMGNQQPASAVVIVGKAPGATTIRVRSRDGDREVRVTVVSPPTPVAASAAR
jgi:hypothetical protein